MDGAFITLTFPTITAGASTYTAKTGSYSAQIYGDLTFEASYHKAYSFFSIPVNENVSEVTVTYYMYMKESTAVVLMLPKLMLKANFTLNIYLIL